MQPGLGVRCPAFTRAHSQAKEAGLHPATMGHFWSALKKAASVFQWHFRCLAAGKAGRQSFREVPKVPNGALSEAYPGLGWKQRSCQRSADP